MSDYSITVEISGEGEKVVKKVYHELVKESDNAARYGHTVNVRRVEVSDKDVSGFDE